MDETTSSFAMTENAEDELASVVAVKKGSLPKFYLNVFKRRWLIILTFAVSGFVPAFLWSKTDPVIYPGSFKMLVEPVTSAEKLTEPTTLARTGGNVNEELLSIDYPTILRILKSNNILQQIAEKVNQNNPLYPPAYLIKTFQKDLGLTPAESLSASTLSQDPKRQRLLLDLQAIDTQIAQQSAQLTENHPNILNLQDQKDNITNLLEKETTRVLQENKIDPNVNPRVFAYQDPSRLALIQKLIETQNQIDTLSSRYQSLKNSQTQTGSQLAVMPGVIKEYNDLDRQISLDTTILNQLTNQRETLGVEIAQKQIPWQILSPPQTAIDEFGNLKGYSPEPEKKLALGTGLGTILGLLVAIALEKRRDIIHETSDLEYAFGLPILGVVELEEKKKDQVTLEEENFFRDSKNVYQKITPVHISLSQVYTNLHFQLPNSHQNRILITSLHPTLRKTFTFKFRSCSKFSRSNCTTLCFDYL